MFIVLPTPGRGNKDSKTSWTHLLGTRQNRLGKSQSRTAQARPPAPRKIEARLERLRIVPGAGSLSPEWKEQLDLADGATAKLLIRLALAGAPVPEVGAEVGDYSWPVDALWQNAKVVLLDDGDRECMNWLTDNGYRVEAPDSRRTDSELRELADELL